MDTAAVEEISRNPALLRDWMQAEQLELLLDVMLEPRVDWGLRRWVILPVAWARRQPGRAGARATALRR